MDLTWEQKKEIIQTFKDDPATTGGRDRMFQKIRFSEQEFASKISRRDVAKFLSEDPAHQIHKPLNKRITARSTISKGPATLGSIDLIDFQQLSGHNSGTRYLLTYIDSFSKYSQVRALPNKKQPTVVKQLLDIINSMPVSWRPTAISMDNGGEFGSQMESALLAIGIKTIHSAPYTPTSHGQIERFNRTIKTDIFQLMTRHNTKRYVDYIQPLVNNYNSSKAAATNEEPLEIMESIPLPPSVIARIQARMRSRLHTQPEDERTFIVGQKVRVALTTESSIRKLTFRKRIMNNWSDGIYEVYAVSAPTTIGTQPQYLLKNLETNRKSLKRYYAYSLLDATNSLPLKVQSEEEEEENYEAPEPEPVPMNQRPSRSYQPSAQALRNFQAQPSRWGS